MQRLDPDTESEIAGRGQLSVIPVTTRPVHSLSALHASFNPLIGNDEYAPNPSTPANKDDKDQGKLSEGFNHATQVEGLQRLPIMSEWQTLLV